MWYTLKDFHPVVQDIAQKEDYFLYSYNKIPKECF
jgi:hypothetical protein